MAFNLYPNSPWGSSHPAWALSQRPSTALMNFLSPADTVIYRIGSGGQIRDNQTLPGTCLGNFSFGLSYFRSKL